MIYNYKDLEGYEENLINSFIAIDDHFLPSLLSRIANNNEEFSVKDYIHKLNAYGDLFLFIDKDEIMGVVALYSNDTINHTAYIPVLFVHPEFNGRGIANALLQKVKETSALNKMKWIRVNTWQKNEGAIRLYEKNGYKIINIDGSNVQLKLEL